MEFLKKGYSLIELLVGVVVLVLLTAIATTTFSKIKKSTYETWAKSELGQISGFMKTAYGADGFYHQYIYQMGYRPKGKIMASVGIPSVSSVEPCCNDLPPLGSLCEGGFLFYNCKSSIPHNLADNVSICNHLGSPHCSLDGALNALGANPFSNLTVDSSCKAQILATNTSKAWCNCKRYTLAAITSYGSTNSSPAITDQSHFSLNEFGKLCQAKRTSHLIPTARR